MAKYVGKIFNVGNNKLKIRSSNSHAVYVERYDPKTKKFNCKVITSLEKEHYKKSVNKAFLQNRNYSYNKATDNYCVLNQSKYKKMRNGVITPIPTNKTKNFKVKFH